jgi:hypothetical protein
MEFKATLAIFPLLVFPFLTGSLVTWKSVSWSARWFLGVSFLGIFLICVHALGLSQSAVRILLVAGLASICVRVYLNRGVLLDNMKLPAWQTLIIAVILLIQLLSACSAILAQPVFEWDAVEIWLQKAKAFYYWEPFKSFPYVNYPNLGAVYWAFIMKFTGPSEAMGRLFFPAAYFAFMMALYSFFMDNRTSLAGVFVVPAVSIFFFHDVYISGYQDGLLCIMAGMAAFCYCRYFIFSESKKNVTADRKDIHHDLFLAFFFSGILGFIKNEGTFIALLLFSSAAGWFIIRKGNRPIAGIKWLLCGMIMFFVLISLWSLLLLFNGMDPSQVQGGGFSVQGILNSYKNMSRYNDIKHFFSLYLTVHGMIIIATGLLSVMAGLYVKSTRIALGIIWTFYVLHFAFVAFVFFSTATNYMWHLETAFNRLMFHHQFVYMLVIVTTTSAIAKSIRLRMSARG